MDLFYTTCKKFDGNTLREKQHNAGRYIVEYVANNIYKLENSELELVNKKPRFKYSDINFSISHCENYAIVVFDNNPVGVDIEKLAPRDFEAIAKRMKFELKENTLGSFYETWTIFEAKYKLQQEAKNVLTIDFMQEYKISVASSKAEKIDLSNISYI